MPAHEFAHQLNDESPHEGAPLLADYARWSKVMNAAYTELCEKGSEVLDDYGTEGPGAAYYTLLTGTVFEKTRPFTRTNPSGKARDDCGFAIVETQAIAIDR